MKRFILLVFCWPVLALSQKLPSVDFDKVRITLPDKVIQAEVYPRAISVKAQANLHYYWYSANVIHATQGGFSGRLLDGSYKEFYLNKNLKEQGHYKKGLKTGEWKSWNDQGDLISSYTWNDGVRSGQFFVYNSDGRLITAGFYENGLLNGNIKNYHTADSVETTKYHNGKIVLPKTDSVSFWKKVNIFKSKRAPDSTRINDK